jgi:carboxyl-terminal processing protease
MVAAAGDRYTVFMDKKEAEEFNKELSGEVTGIGCELSVRNDQPTAVRVLEGSPAQQAGIMAGDVFVSVNDDSVVGADSSTVASKIRGEAGTTVKVVVMRGVDTKSFTITRAKLNDVSVRATVQDGVGIMTITRFDQDSGDLARKAAQDFKIQGVRGVIVDLRDNGGGYVTAAQAVGGLWLDDKLLFTTKDSAGNSQNVSTNGGEPILAGIKTVVLVNGGTASASEIVAGALQEYELAMVIGEKTFGKGTEQQVIDLPDGRKLKVTIARWYTPKGKNITKEGIAPTTTVSLGTDDVNAGRDPQMDAAKAAVAK